MLSRKSGLLLLLTVLSASLAGLLCHAQQAQPTITIRYHFGDDPDGKLGWANPNFNDSAWPIAKDRQWPMPPFFSDGFVWVRYRIPVRSGVDGPFAVRSWPPFLVAVDINRQAAEIYAGGQLVGRQGGLPPQVDLDLDHRDAVFDLPVSAASPGTTTLVALRTWYPPVSRGPTPTTTWNLSVDESRVLQLARRADHANITYANLPDLELNGLMVLLGVGVFFAWRRLGGRDLLVFSWALIAHALFELDANPSLPGLGALSWQTGWLVLSALVLAGLLADVEFTWTIHGVDAPRLKRLAQAFVVTFVVTILYLVLPTTPTAITGWAGPTYLLLSLGSILILVGVNLWAILVRRKNQLIAVAIIAFATASFLSGVGVLPGGVMVGPFYEHTVGLTFFFFAIALFLLLSGRAWKAWRARDELRIEFEAAREVQQQLVVPAKDVPGFRIESAYVPAKQVCGDFFRIQPQQDGGVLVVVGDVSGKGLKAAMTVSVIMGALHDYSSTSPAEVLAHLNCVLHGRVSGFVTCCATFIEADGGMTLANAGNPAPYRNGQEMAVEPGLPLGLLADATYAETRYQLAPSDRLTFISDGVLEATNPQGELYGFARTQAISTESAAKIANTAELFGQDDDITVLTLTRTVGLNPALA